MKNFENLGFNELGITEQINESGGYFLRPAGGYGNSTVLSIAAASADYVLDFFQGIHEGLTNGLNDYKKAKKW
ncbi:hypothetical protein V7S76_10415 [Aquirufa sp. ROCK2-A2]